MSIGESKQTATRVDRLLRSLVGVKDVRFVWNAQGALRGVHLLKADDVQQHQLVRNVVSGLKAGFGIKLDPSHVQIHERVEQLESAVPADERAQPEQAMPAVVTAAVEPNIVEQVRVEAAPAQSAQVERRSPLRPRSAGNAGSARRLRTTPPVVAASNDGMRAHEPAFIYPGEILLEHIDVERHGAALRCRVVLAHQERSYSAVAEAPDGPAAEAELAARVALDALRAGGMTNALLQGVGLIKIGDCNHVVAAVKDNGYAPRAGAAPLIDSMAWSAALAIVNAVCGSSTMIPVRSPMVAFNTQ